MVLKSHSLSERSQAIFHRTFFDTYIVPDELQFGKIRAFTVSARHLIKALDTPKAVIQDRMLSIEREPTQTVLTVVKRLQGMRIRNKIDVAETTEDDFVRNQFDGCLPIFSLDQNSVRLLHPTLKYSSTPNEPNIELDVHPVIGVRARGLGPLETETFLLHSSFTSRFEPVANVIFRGVLGPALAEQRAKLERGYELKMHLNRLVRAGAFADTQKHNVRLYVEKLFKNERAINLAHLVVGNVKNYELTISSNSNLRERDLLRDDSFKRSQISSFSEMPPSMPKFNPMPTPPPPQPEEPMHFQPVEEEEKVKPEVEVEEKPKPRLRKIPAAFMYDPFAILHGEEEPT